ncbi:MAG: response regulator [Bacteroidota bacterium]
MKSTSTEKTILIAEDEEINYFLLERLISILAPDIKVLHAVNGKEAVEICNKNKIHLVLMDLKMPIMDGYEATLLIKKDYPDLPVVVQTAFCTNEEERKSALAGSDYFLSKPITEKSFNFVIAKFFSNSQ